MGREVEESGERIQVEGYRRERKRELGFGGEKEWGEGVSEVIHP